MLTNWYFCIQTFLMKVEMSICAGEKAVTERPWHRGDMDMEHVATISKKPLRVLPP